jgi:hypothetical protein
MPSIFLASVTLRIENEKHQSPVAIVDTRRAFKTLLRSSQCSRFFFPRQNHNPANRLYILPLKATKSAKMLPPPPTWTRTAIQNGGSSSFCSFCKCHENKNGIDASTTTTTKPEDDTSAQLEEGAGAPEVSKQQQPPKRSSCAMALFKLTCFFGIGLLILWALIVANIRLKQYNWREKEASFRAYCDAAGGRIEVRPGWGVGRVDCLHGEGEGKGNMSLGYDRGNVFVWR